MSTSSQVEQPNLVTTFLPATNAVDSRILPSTNLLDQRNHLVNGQQCRVELPRAREANNQIQNQLTFIDILIRRAKRNCLLSCLLGATLVASVANTLLLSFVVKWIQSSDRGLMRGKIKWDKDSDTTLFQLFTRMPDKSISLKSIESFNDKPLRLDILEKANIQQSPNLRHSNHRTPIHHQVFLSYEQAHSSDGSHHQKAVADYDSESNYLAAVNVNSSKFLKSRDDKRSITNNLSKALEIETKSLVLNLLNDEQHQTNKPAPQLVSTDSAGAKYKKAPSVVDSDIKNTTTIKRLLEFNARLLSISLPLETKLNLNPLTSHTLIVNEEFKSPDIVGTLEGNLDIQTRNSSIFCESDQVMKLVSKSGALKFTSSKDLNINSPVLLLNPHAHLYFQNGIEYFDSSYEISRIGRQQTNKSSYNLRNPAKAYNLVTINGVIMASA